MSRLLAALVLGLLLLAPWPGDVAARGQGDGIARLSRQLACGRRYAPASEIAVDPRLPVLEAVRQAFRPSRLWGIAENAALVASADGPAVLAVRYPEGSIAPSSAAPRGGAGFVSRAGLDQGVDAACLVYRVRFAAGFAFAKGGKLPGLFGGDGPTGGAGTEDGFSARLMWRQEGAGELYAYLPKAIEGPARTTGTGKAFGSSLGRGAWRFPAGRWVSVEQEIVLNDPGLANGVARLWIGGRLRLEQQGLVFRRHDGVRIEGLMFSTFFGGHDPSWASPKDQEARFADFAVHLPAEGHAPAATASAGLPNEAAGSS